MLKAFINSQVVLQSSLIETIEEISILSPNFLFNQSSKFDCQFPHQIVVIFIQKKLKNILFSKKFFYFFICYFFTKLNSRLVKSIYLKQFS